MKTREDIIEDYFWAQGWKKEDPPSKIVHPAWIMPDGRQWAGESLPPIDQDFNLFREHVIEPMRGRGFEPRQREWLGLWEYQEPCHGFAWWNKEESLNYAVRVIDDQWLLAAIEAATSVLEGEKG